MSTTLHATNNAGDTEVGAPDPSAAAEQYNREASGRPDVGADVLGSPFDGTSRVAHRATGRQQVGILCALGALA